MREGNHSDRIIVFNEGESVTKMTIVDKIANSTHSRSQLIFLDFTLEKLLNIVDVETASAELEVVRLLGFTILFIISYGVRSLQRVTDRVEVALMHVLTASDVEVIKGQLYFHLPVIDLDFLGRDLHITISVFSQFVSCDIERVDGRVIAVNIIDLQRLIIAFIHD